MADREPSTDALLKTMSDSGPSPKENQQQQPAGFEPRKAYGEVKLNAISGEGQVVERGHKRSKVRTTVPNEGVELAIGKGALEGAEPVTFGQLFQQRVQEFPDVAALKWKEKEEGVENKMVWKSATYKEYYRSCINAAKSFLKVNRLWYIYISLTRKLNYYIPSDIICCTIAWSGG